MGSLEVDPENHKLLESASTRCLRGENSADEGDRFSPQQLGGKTEHNGETSDLNTWCTGFECPPASLISSDDESKIESHVSGGRGNHPFFCESEDTIHSNQKSAADFQGSLPHYLQGTNLTRMMFGGRGDRNQHYKMTRTRSVGSHSSHSSEHTLTKEPYQIHHYF